MEYTKAGTYVAILSKINFDGYYTQVFEYPGEEKTQGSARDYFFDMNLSAHSNISPFIFPIELFAAVYEAALTIQCAWCRNIKIGGVWFRVEPVKEETFVWIPSARVSHGICPKCAEVVKRDRVPR